METAFIPAVNNKCEFSNKKSNSQPITCNCKTNSLDYGWSDYEQQIISECGGVEIILLISLFEGKKT